MAAVIAADVDDCFVLLFIILFNCAIQKFFLYFFCFVKVAVKEKQILAQSEQGVFIAMQQNGTDDGVFDFATPEDKGKQLSTVISNNFLATSSTQIPREGEK